MEQLTNINHVHHIREHKAIIAERQRVIALFEKESVVIRELSNLEFIYSEDQEARQYAGSRQAFCPYGDAICENSTIWEW